MFRSHFPLIALCLAAFGFYLSLIYHNPTIYWYDSQIRWALRDQLLVGHWLPVIQTFVLLASKITFDLILLRTILSILAIGTLVSSYILARRLFSPVAGFIAFAFLAVNTMFAALAIVPYPDVLFLGLTFLTFSLLDEPGSTRDFNLGLIALNLACLTRYDGWFLSAVLIAEVVLRSLRSKDWKPALRRTLKMAVLCSIAPMAWLIFGFSEPGGLINRVRSILEFVLVPRTPQLSDHLFARLNLAHLSAFSSQYFYLLRWQIHPEFLVLGLVGFLFAIRDRAHSITHLRILAFLLLDWCVVAFLQPWGFGNLRQPFLLQGFLILYASNGLVRIVSWLWQRLPSLKHRPQAADWVRVSSILVAVLLSARLIPLTTRFVAENSRGADFLIPYEIGKWLSNRFSGEDAIMIIDDTDYYPYALAANFDYPLARILDDRLDPRFIRETLQQSRMVYVIDLYSDRDGLSLSENRLLKDLESGTIKAERFDFDTSQVWYLPADQLIDYP